VRSAAGLRRVGDGWHPEGAGECVAQGGEHVGSVVSGTQAAEAGYARPPPGWPGGYRRTVADGRLGIGMVG
jgi:hypothetical protein